MGVFNPEGKNNAVLLIPIHVEQPFAVYTHTVDTFCMEMRSTSRAQDIGLDGGMMGGSESVWSGNEAV